MKTIYLRDIESWWKNLDIWGRETVSGYPVEDFDGEREIYLDTTDGWWDSLDTAEKYEVYEFYLDEC